MHDSFEHPKPSTIVYATYALVLWVAVQSASGYFEAKTMVGDLEEAIGMAGLSSDAVPADMLLQCVLTGYVLIIAIAIYVVWRAAVGKNWARWTVLSGAVFDALMMLVPPYHSPLTYAPTLIQIGLQAYASWLFFTWPGRRWFERESV